VLSWWALDEANQLIFKKIDTKHYLLSLHPCIFGFMNTTVRQKNGTSCPTSWSCHNNMKMTIIQAAKVLP